MKQSLRTLFFLIPLALAGLPAQTAIYEEVAGRVTVEAENFHSRVDHPSNLHHWHVVPDDNGVDAFADSPNNIFTGSDARGGRYIQNLPESGANNTTDASVNNAPWVDYKVYIKTLGTYRLYLRWRGYDGGSDSMYAQILELKDGPGGAIADWYGFSGGAATTFGVWRTAQAPEVSNGSTVAGTSADWVISNPGVYTIRLSHREDGVAVDALSLQLTNLAAPANPGPAESSISTNTPPFVRFLSPGAGARNVFPDATMTVEIADATFAVNTNSIQLILNNAVVSPTIETVDSVTTLRFTPSTLFRAGSTNVAQVIFNDSAPTPGRHTNTWTFVVENYPTLGTAQAISPALVNTNLSGFTFRVAQGPDNARYPGADFPGNLRRAEDQIALRLTDIFTGLPMTNYAVPGPGTNGTYLIEVVNLNQNQSLDPFSTTDSGNITRTTTTNAPYPDLPIPGIPGVEDDGFGNTISTDNIAGEMISYLQLFPGLYRFGVNSDDGFKITTSVDPYDLNPLLLAQFNAGRGAADTLFSLLVTNAGIYPVRLVWFEGGGGASVEFFSVNLTNGTKMLINDRTNGGVVAYAAITNAGPFALASPLPSSTGVFAGSPISVQIFNRDTAVVTNTIQLLVNGSLVTPSIGVTNGATWVYYDPAGNWPSGSTNQIRLIFRDNSSPAVSYTNAWQFVVQDYSSFPVIPASYAVPVSLVNINNTGFSVETYQMGNDSGTVVARTGFANNNSVDAAEFQFARGFINPTTGMPYGNLAAPGSDPDGRHPVDVINWNELAPANSGGFNNGNGNADSTIPGLGAADQNWVVGESIAYVDLKAGVYQFIANVDDGFKLTTAPDPRSKLGIQLGLRSPGGGVVDTPINFVVEQDGIYPIRFLWWEGTGGAAAEFVIVDQMTGARRLVNDRTTYFSVPTYRTYVGPPEASVTSVSPIPGATGVLADSRIELVFTNLTGPVTLTLNGTNVAPTVINTGSNTIVRYQPTNLFNSLSTNVVTVAYGDVTNTFNFVVGAYTTLSSAQARSISEVNTNATGFKARIVQAPAGAPLAGTIQRAEDHLAGLLVDTNTGQPYPNEAIAGPGPNGEYFINHFINWNEDAGGLGAERGNFNFNNGFADEPIPGIPGTTGQFDLISGEVLAWLNLPQGLTRLGVNSDDGFRVTLGTNNTAGDQELGVFNAPRGAADTTFSIVAPTAGLYPIRLVWFEGAGDASLEFFSVNAAGQRTLINDTNNPASIKAFYSLLVTNVALPQITSIHATNGSVTVRWIGGGLLQSTTNLFAPTSWTSVGTNGLFSEPVVGNMKFYRVMR